MFDSGIKRGVTFISTAFFYILSLNFFRSCSGYTLQSFSFLSLDCARDDKNKKGFPLLSGLGPRSINQHYCHPERSRRAFKYTQLTTL